MSSFTKNFESNATVPETVAQTMELSESIPLALEKPIDLGINEQMDTSVDNIINSPKESHQKRCIIKITNNTPFDKSDFLNNDNTFSACINYNQLLTLYNCLCSLDESEQTQTTSMSILYIIECYKNLDIFLMFRLLCSSDCYSGDQFINTKYTELVFNFIKLVSNRSNTVIEVSDHSAGSLFNNWTIENMDIESPIQVLPQTNGGTFKMSGLKADFVSSKHPTLIQIGNMSSEDNIEITFENMGGTLMFKLPDMQNTQTNVRIISSGYPVQSQRQIGRLMTRVSEEDNNNQLYESLPVHFEFDYNLITIVCSATHWCNLENVETKIDIPTLRRYYTETYGEEAQQELSDMLDAIDDPIELKRELSNCVRCVSSGAEVNPKKIRVNTKN
jgi:hypothetical protein